MHRRFVEQHGQLVGAFGTKDLLLAIGEKRDEKPFFEVMSSPVFVLPVTESLSVAVDRIGSSAPRSAVS